MWKARLQDNYSSFDEWTAFSQAYGLAERLGYKSDEEAWTANPILQGSTNPADFKVIGV